MRRYTSVNATASVVAGPRRLFGDCVTTLDSTTVTSAIGAFVTSDVGLGITGAGIQAGTTIVARPTLSQITLSLPATVTATGVVLTVARPNSGALVGYGSTRFDGTVSMHGAGTLDFYVRDGALTGTVAPYGLIRTGSGGTLTLDSGTGGSYIEAKAFRLRMTDQTGARYVALCSALPADATLNNGEVGIYFDKTTGELKFKGKTSAGTVITKTITAT